MKKRPKVLIIVGPTASGKSGLGVLLAKKFNGEIISADSRQVYRGLDIGTAKATKEETGDVPHHLIDIHDINDVYTAAEFKIDASRKITEIIAREKLSIVVGGTFFYIDVLLDRVSPAPVEPNPKLREELEKKSVAELSVMLEKLDPNRYSTVERDNKRRLIRAIEIAKELDFVPINEPLPSPYETLIIGIKTEKESLRKAYEKRAKKWLTNGFKDEVLGLLKKGITRERLSEIGFEYTLMLSLIDEEITEEEFIQKFIEKNWQYAKRQTTWLKHDETIKWFQKDDRKIIELVGKFVKD